MACCTIALDMRKYLNIKQQLQDVGLGLDECVVIGSGALNALKLRPAKDIDLMVSEDTYQKLKESGDFRIGTWPDQEVLLKGVFEIGRIWGGENFESAYKKAFVIDGVAYFNLQDLRKWKLAKGRDKDLRDVQLLDNYLKINK